MFTVGELETLTGFTMLFLLFVEARCPLDFDALVVVIALLRTGLSQKRLSQCLKSPHEAVVLMLHACMLHYWGKNVGVQTLGVFL